MRPTDLNSETIAQALSLEYGTAVKVTALTDAAFKEELADATLKFRVTQDGGPGGFLLVSGAGNPHLLARAKHNIDTARASLPPPTAASVLAPISSGQIAGREFAIWPEHRPFHSPNRFVRRTKYSLYQGKIVSWARNFCLETLTPARQAQALDDLRLIREDVHFDEDMRRAADRAETRITSDLWQPMHCLQHGDFWPENILLPATSGGPAFYVIDWAGMAPQGYPFLDLARMLMSLRCSKRFAARSIDRLCTQIGCDKEDVPGYVLCGTAQIGRTLENFPPDRYRAAARAVFDYVSGL